MYCCNSCIKRCQHSVCSKNCSELCADCVEPCLNQCEHRKCSLKCFEVCNLEPCQEKCTKKLSCGHICLGFCNEICLKYCITCKQKVSKEKCFYEGVSLLDISDHTVNETYVYMQDCGHIFHLISFEMINGATRVVWKRIILT
jgi:hypothetical protein